MTSTNEGHHDVTRRRFMSIAGLVGIGAVGTALVPDGVRIERQTSANAEAMAGMDTAATASANPTVAAAQTASEDVPMTADQMDAIHEAGIKSFPAATKGEGGVPLKYEMDGEVKVFRLTSSVIQWEFDAGKTTEAWAYNGIVPGPEIRATEGDRVRIILENQLPESTAIHWHGLIVPNDQDGVPFITQPPIKPGTTYTYEFTLREGNAGSHMYHSHMNSAKQVTMGLLGAFIVEPKDVSTRPAFDREYTIILNDGPIGGFSLNGKSFPATKPLTAKKGEKVLIRYMNEGLMIHPMHLHGMPQTVIAHDGWLLPQPYKCDTINIAPGQRFEAIVDAKEVGTWAFHCHILSHAESDRGMFGMVTVLVIEA